MASSDNFNRIDGWLEESPTSIASGGWTWTWDGLVAHGLSVYQNILYSGTASADGTSYWTNDTGSADHYVQYKIPAGLVGTLNQNFNQSHICCRHANNFNFVGIHVGNGGAGAGQIEVVKRTTSGGWTVLYVSGAGAVAIGDVLRLECSGNNWTVKKNGSLVSTGSIGDVALNSAKTGIVAHGMICEIADDFEAGSLVATSSDTWDDADSKTWDENDGQTWNLSGISVSPTGQALTTSLGTVLVSSDARVNVLGQQIAVAANSVTATIKKNVPVTGQFVTLDVGDVAVRTDFSVIPNGVVANVFLRNVTVRTQTKIPVTGVSATLALGNVIVELKTIVPVEGFALGTRLNSVEVTGDANAYVTGEAAYIFDGFVTARGGAISTIAGETLLVGLGDVAVRTSVHLSVAGFQLDAELGQAYFGGWSPTIPTDESDELHEQWTPIDGGNQDWGPVIGGSEEQQWIPIQGGSQNWIDVKPTQNKWTDGVIPHGQ